MSIEIKGNQKITDLIEKFATIYSNSIKKLQKKDLDRFNTKALNEIKIFLLEPLEDLINYFYGSAIEKIVIEKLLKQDNFIKFFKQNLIHFLVFKENPQILEQINKICSKSTSYIRNKKPPRKFPPQIPSSLLRDCLEDEESINLIEKEKTFQTIMFIITQLKTIKTPYEKLNHINYLNKEIVKVLDHLIQNNNMNISYGGDERISLMRYLLVKSEYLEIHSDIEFIQMFYDDYMKQNYEEFETIFHYVNLFSTVEFLKKEFAN